MKTVQTRVTTRSRKATIDNNHSDVDKGIVKSNVKNAKVAKKRTRRALADRTNSNSGSDLNSSSPSKKVLKSAANVCPASENRPKRTRQVPSRFQDHLLSPASRKKGSFTSTPLSSSLSANRKAQITCKLSPIVEPASDTSRDKSEDVRTNKSKIADSKKTKPPLSKNASTKLVNKSGTSSAVVSRKSNSKTQRKTSVDKVLIFDKTSTSIQNQTSLRSPKNQVPVYKKNIIGDELRADNKSMLYEFEFDPTNEPKMVKKKKILKNKKPDPEVKNPIKRKKKKMSRKSADLAMMNLIENLKKIQAEKMMKKLVSKIKPKEPQNIENNVSVTSPSVPNEILSEKNTAPPVQPLPTYNSNDDRPPSPWNSEDMNFPDVEESNHPNVSSNNESLRFSNHPIANSSAIVNEKPNCSPWRMNLDSDVKKWRYNFPVKPSMTPAYERDTFHVLGLDDKVEDGNEATNSNKKTSTNEVVSSTPIKPVEMSENTKKLLQTSILSFYADSFKKSPQKRAASKNKSKKFNFDAYSSSFDFSNEKECEVENNSAEKPAENIEPAIENCFGFDDNFEDIDQENISPDNKKKSPEKRSLRIQKNVASILKEINNKENHITVPKEQQPPIVRKERSPKKSPIIEQSSIFSQENISEDNTTNMNTTIEENPEKECPLFEDPVDVEVVHYNKPTRRSYGRQRKPPVRFQNTVLNDEVEDEVSDAESVKSVKYVMSSKTFKKRKAKKVPHLSKKEEKEIAEWAAGFNSMLEEIEDFPLCVE